MGHESIPPPFIIHKKEQEVDNRISLEIPDYSFEYEEYMRRKSLENPSEKEETVIIIDIY